MPTALVIHPAGGLGGGTASFLDVLHMLSGTFDVVAACPSLPSDAGFLVRRDGFKIHPLPIPAPEFHAYNSAPGFTSRQFWKGALRSFRYTDIWVNWISSINADVVVINSSALMPLGPAIREAGVKGVCIIRETIVPGQARGRLMFGGLSKWFDGVVFISEFDRMRAGPLDPPAIVARDCVRPEAFRRLDRASACRHLGLDDGAFNVLFTGGHSWLKGLDVALAAVEAARVPHLRLVVAGDYRTAGVTAKDSLMRLMRFRSRLFDERVEGLMARDTLRESVNIVGAQQDMSACYSAADLVVFPAVLAHQARPLLEAAHYGLPVVCSDFPQYAEHAPSRFAFVPGDPEGMARCIAQVLGDYPAALRGAKVNKGHSELMNDIGTEGARLSQFVLAVHEIGT